MDWPFTQRLGTYMTKTLFNTLTDQEMTYKTNNNASIYIKLLFNNKYHSKTIFKIVQKYLILSLI